MNIIKTLGISFAIGLMLHASFGLAAEKKKSPKATLYKWVDNNGETHYGEVVPPEYADRDKTQISTQNTKGKNKASKPTSVAVEMTQERITALEQRRKDRALLNTYSNEKEIDLARGRNLQQVEARIHSIELQSKTADASLQGYLLEQTNLKKAGKAIPESLQSDIANGQKRIATLQLELGEAKEKAAAVSTVFAANKARYHELTTTAPTAPAPAPAK